MSENENTTPAATEERPLSPSEAYEASQLTSFFDSAAPVAHMDAETPAPDSGQEGQQSAEWYFNEKIKGDGARPAWLKDKYKSVADQAAAYSELEKKLGEFKGAPKEGYKLDDIEGIDMKDPLLEKFLPKFKEMNMSQDAVKALINEFSSYKTELSTVNVKEEIKKLGLEGQDMINKTNQWMANNLDPEVAETIKSWIHTAEDMKALNALRSFQPLSRSPNVADMQSAVTYETLKEVKNEKINNWERYKEDVNYRNSVNERMERAVHREEASKKR
jgi:hypothetical protein